MIEGFKILDFNDIQPQIEELHKNGWDSGKFVGFDSFYNHYNMKSGSCTDWTGYPSHGKTEICLELLLNMTAFYGWKHLIYAPDIGNAIDIMAKLIHKHTGKTFKKKYNNFIEIKTAFSSCTHLIDNFKILHRTKTKAIITPIKLWEYAIEYSKENKLNTVMLDSWKDMYHDYKSVGGSYAQYLSNILPMRNELAELSGLHFHTIIHPKNPQRNDNRKIYPPSYDDMEGGAQWGNSGKSIIAVHRENFDDNRTDIYFRKIKPESVGIASSTPISLNFDFTSSRYFATDSNGNKLFAHKKGEEEVIKPPIKQAERHPLNPPKEKQEDLPF